MESPRSKKIHKSKENATPFQVLSENSTDLTFTLTSDFKPIKHPKSLRLPVEEHSPSPLKLLCISAYEGDPAWLRTIHPHQQSWAERHQVELKIGNEPETTTFSRAAIHAWLAFFLKSNADWLLYFSSRVMIHPLAPNPLAGNLAHGVWALPQPVPEPTRSIWAKWVHQNFQHKVSQSYQFRNGGVWLMDRATAEGWLAYSEEMMLPNVPEEYYFNLWLLRASLDRKIQLHSLPLEWNQLPQRCAG